MKPFHEWLTDLSDRLANSCNKCNEYDICVDCANKEIEQLTSGYENGTTYIIHDYEDGDLDRWADWEQEDRLNNDYDFYGD